MGKDARLCEVFWHEDYKLRVLLVQRTITILILKLLGDK